MLTYIQPSPSCYPHVSVKSVVDSGGKKSRGRGAEESREMPYGNALAKLGLAIPAAHKEYDNRAKCRFKQADHESKGIHVIAVSSSGLCEPKGTQGYKPVSCDETWHIVFLSEGNLREDSPSNLAGDKAYSRSDLEGNGVGWDLYDCE